MAWIERIDPGTHRRIKGLRLVTACGIASLLGTVPSILQGLQGGKSLAFLAGGFALWASVSEARIVRCESSRDLALLCGAGVLGAMLMIGLTPLVIGTGRPGAELILASGAFLVGYLKRYGVLGAGIGSQIYLGQLFAFGLGLTAADVRMVGVAGLIGAVGAIVPRLLSGPAEHPAVLLTTMPGDSQKNELPALFMGLQAAAAAVLIVALNDAIGLTESAWAITASTYVIASSAAGTIERVRRRIVGTMIGVPLGLLCLPVADRAPLVVWVAAGVAMIVYAMALPERYDVACAAFAFALIVTMAAAGDHSFRLLASRGWETVIGGVVGAVAAMLIVPRWTLRHGR
ncbi:FUSC family protein [Tunturibacter psychrotolerans]|uniref:FUSC family protein n=1 Tax=Tunturiibacter psychrotolerans TaxID=3069686 RepID=A0AAU7ZLN3_9BACT